MLVLQSNIRVANNQEKGITRHVLFARDHRRWFAIVETDNQAAFVGYYLGAYGWLTVPCQVEAGFSLAISAT